MLLMRARTSPSSSVGGTCNELIDSEVQQAASVHPPTTSAMIGLSTQPAPLPPTSLAVKVAAAPHRESHLVRNTQNASPQQQNASQAQLQSFHLNTLAAIDNNNSAACQSADSCLRAPLAVRHHYASGNNGHIQVSRPTTTSTTASHNPVGEQLYTCSAYNYQASDYVLPPQPAQPVEAEFQHFQDHSDYVANYSSAPLTSHAQQQHHQQHSVAGGVIQEVQTQQSLLVCLDNDRPPAPLYAHQPDGSSQQQYYQVNQLTTPAYQRSN
jgi:hypothetical protein